MALGWNLYRSFAEEWPLGGPRLLLNPRLDPSLFQRILREELPDQVECVWLATSGTQRDSGFKLVALSKGALEASARRVNAFLGVSRTDLWINALPHFHVGGLSVACRTALAGCGVFAMRAWSAEAFLDNARRLSATLASLVPTQVHDLVKVGAKCPDALRSVVVGGGSLNDGLHARALELGWPILRSYGMTEAASQAATELTPGSSASGWLTLLDHFEARTDEHGVLELCGPSLLTGWIIFGNSGTVRWDDPKQHGWFRTKDRVELRGRQLRVLGRVDDLVKIRGELVDVGALENALQARVAVGRVAVHCLPDERNGVALRVIAENSAALRAVLSLCEEIFPPYARPQEIVEGPVEITALGKTVRRSLGLAPQR